MYEKCISVVVATLNLWWRRVCVRSAAGKVAVRVILILLKIFLTDDADEAVLQPSTSSKEVKEITQTPSIKARSGKCKSVLAISGLRCFPCFHNVPTHRSLIEGIIGLITSAHTFIFASLYAHIKSHTVAMLS